MSDSDSQSTLSNSEFHLASEERRLPPGTYIMINRASGTVADQAGGSTKAVIGYPGHGGQNQQWIVEELGDGYSIRGRLSGHYLTVETGIGNGVPIVASRFPVSWEIESDELEVNLWRVRWPNTEYALDLADYGSAVPGTQVQLWQLQPDQPSTKWNLVRCEDDVQESGVVADTSNFTHSTADTTVEGNLGSDGLKITTTITTTTTTVTKIARGKAFP